MRLTSFIIACLLLLAAACGDDDDAADEPAGTSSPAVSSPAAEAPSPSATATPAIQPTSTQAVPTPEPTSTPPLPTQTPAAQPAPTQPPAPTEPPAQPQPSQPVTLNVSALNIAFNRGAISVPANTQVTVNFTNNDESVPHDFGVSIPSVPHTETCVGPCNASITFNSGPPGTYTFQCSIHASMVGTFTVE